MLFVLRHGEIEWNRVGRFQGQKDSPLTALGEAQAAAIRRLLKRYLTDLESVPIWCNPLGRACRSCELVCAALGIEPGRIQESDALKEINFGHWEGITATEAAMADRDAYDLRYRDKFHNPVPGGESYRDVYQRVSSWIGAIDPQYQTVILAHGSLNRVVAAATADLISRAVP